MSDASITTQMPRKVPAGASLGWLRNGFALYRKAAGTWIGLTLLLIVGMVIIGLIPFIGGLGVQLAMPVIYGGLALGCRALDQGERFTLDAIWAGFTSPYRGKLLGLALLNLLLFVVAGIVGFLILKSSGAFPDFARMGAHPMAMHQLDPALFETFLTTFFVVMLLIVLIGMATWLAPALVALGAQGPLTSIQLSFRASLVNWLALTVFGLVLIGATIGLLVVIAVLSAVSKLLIIAVPLLFVLVIWPMMFAVNYFAYLDFFAVSTTPQPAAFTQPGSIE